MKMSKVFILREAKCPKCGDPNAYIGLNDVECPTCDKKAKGGKRIYDFDFTEMPGHDPKAWIRHAMKNAGVDMDKVDLVVDPNGPGGGNPNATVTFDDEKNADIFEDWLQRHRFAWTDENGNTHDDHC